MNALYLTKRIDQALSVIYGGFGLLGIPFGNQRHQHLHSAGHGTDAITSCIQSRDQWHLNADCDCFQNVGSCSQQECAAWPSK